MKTTTGKPGQPKALTSDEVEAIRYRHGMYRETVAELAECFEVSTKTIQHALNGTKGYVREEAAE